MKSIFTSLLLIAFISTAQAQINVRDSIVSSWMFSFKLGLNIPSGDLDERFGNALGIGLDFDKKTRKNWLFGVDGTFYFGNDVKDLYPIFEDIITDQGLFIGLNGELAGVEFLQRGFYGGAHVGKIFPFFGPNPNSGLMVKLGVGYTMSKIFVRAPNAQVPQIEGEYLKGYDRLHTGFALRQQINYMNSGSKRTINFILGFEFIEGFTTNKRQYNYDTRMADISQKIDVYMGMHLTWFLPIYDKNQQKFFYY
mgnify:CR=1 FL=1|jgi:hypothetical protein